MALDAINFIVWTALALSLMWATHSCHVRDGVMIKIALASLAIGAVANGLKPTFISQLWVGCSFMAAVLFVFVRIWEAKIKGRKPVFIAF